ncbi:MAG: DUF7009 family protein [Bdellovibrionota bacterium]
MKLRIRGNSLRFRLTRGEVSRIGDGVAVEECIRFSPHPAHRLEYRIAPGTTGSIHASFFQNRIEVALPFNVAKEWAASEQIGLCREQEVIPGLNLKILIEKDLACLTPRLGEDDSDAFPNPKTSC